MFRSALTAAFLLLASTAPAAFAQSDGAEFVWGKVTAIQDGDTVVLVDDKGKEHRVQLAYIDAPDLDYKTGEAQPLQKESTKRLAELVRGKDVIVETFGTDQFGRIDGMIFLDKLNINVDMVRAGFAEVYYPVRTAPASYRQPYVNELLEAEKMAKEKKSGIWGADGYVSPYEFRRRNK